MSKFKLEFQLKQHTPLIHFQHDQSGATLRATELKPKLDRFLKAKGLALPFGEHGELDYKVRVKAKFGIEEPELPHRRDPLYFGNMGEGKDKYFVRAKNDKVEISFFTFNGDIKKAIDKYFAEFIMKTNFGTRQSKGFGSFYLSDTDKHYIKPNLNYKFFVDTTDFKNLFRSIEIFYKTLRSGINLKDKNGDTVFYFKSLMFLYAKSKGIQWDKKSIKETYFSRELEAQKRKHGSTDILTYASQKKYLMKDLLGLSSSESWLSYRGTIEKENDSVDRFKSPITFKPIRNDKGFDVYFFSDRIENDFLDKTFQIKFNNRNELSLKTPETFDVDDFIQFALKTDIPKHVDSKFHNTKEFELIESIYKDLKKSLRGAK